jgi:hypothetical protein
MGSFSRGPIYCAFEQVDDDFVPERTIKALEGRRPNQERAGFHGSTKRRRGDQCQLLLHLGLRRGPGARDALRVRPQ